MSSVWIGAAMSVMALTCAGDGDSQAAAGVVIFGVAAGTQVSQPSVKDFRMTFKATAKFACVHAKGVCGLGAHRPCWQ